MNLISSGAFRFMSELRPLLHKWFNVALLNFGLAAVIGCVIRALWIWEAPLLRFNALMNAHSHVAMLDWISSARMLFLLRNETAKRPSRWSFALLVTAQVAVVGMLVGFPVQSYGPFTIAVSVLHMVVGYMLGVQAWKATRGWQANGSRLLVRIALVCMYVSTFGVWATGLVVSTAGFGTEPYYWSIPFYLP